MRLSPRVRLAAWCCCFAAVCSSAGPSAVVAADLNARPLALSPSTPILDVALGAAGAMRGQVVDGQGAPRAGAAVRFSREGKLLGVTHADGSGNFAVSGLEGAVYQLDTEHGAVLVRAWAEGTAPPSARSGLLVIDQPGVVRGQMPLMSVLGSTPVVVGLAAVAVGVPATIQLQQNRVNRRSGS